MRFNSGVKDSIVAGLGNEDYVLVPSTNSILNGSDDKLLAKKIGELALAELNIYKNTYNDTMFKFMDKVKEYIGKDVPLGIESKYSIMESDKPEVLKILNEQGYFKDVNGFDDLGTASVILPIPENIVDYLYAQETVFIGVVENLKSKYSPETFREIWSTVLTNVSSRNDEIDTLFYSGANNLDKLFILLSFVNFIIENARVEDTVLVSGQLQIIRKLKYNIFVAISNISTSFDKNEEIGLLISSLVNLDNGLINVNVNKVNYDKFLEEGGSVECLLGFLLTKFAGVSNSNNIYKEILEDKSRYEAQYASILTTDKIRRSVETNNKLITYYSIALSEMYREFTDEAKNIYVPDINVADKLLEEVLKYKNSNEQLNIELVAYDLFRKIATLPNYVKFMDSMSEISSSNPDLDSKQCASLAFVDLILSFTLDQMSIVKYNKIQGRIETGVAL